MIKNPILNAVAASVYIVMIVLVIFYGMETAAPREKTLFAPIVMLSLLTLSAAVMGYLFLFQPIMLYLEGKKKASVNFLVQTIASFATITTVIAILYFSRILP